MTKYKYSEYTMNKVKELSANGFNSVEIAKMLNYNPQSIRRIKVELKKIFLDKNNKGDIECQQ